MTLQEFAARYGLDISDAQQRAANYLERIGQRFLCDFGYENAVEKAREHWRMRRTKAKASKVKW